LGGAFTSGVTDWLGVTRDSVIGWLNQWPWNTQPDFERRRRLKSYYAVSIYGSGHVMAYDYWTHLINYQSSFFNAPNSEPIAG